MRGVNIVIDGKKIEGHKDMTILEAANSVGIYIPTLCHKKELTPFGGCRICVVEVEGAPILIAACHTPISDGMVINTHSPKVLTSRRVVLELLLAGHTGPCVTDTLVDQCELHKLAADIEAGPPRFRVRSPRFYPAEDVSPYVRRDLSKCILCGRCIRACREIAGQELYAMAYRGIRSKVVVDCDAVLNNEVCKECGICVDYCPTSALTWVGSDARGEGKRREGKAEGDREKLLDLLEEKQKELGCIPEPVIGEIAGELGLSVSDVYGVATVYAFLSVEPQGRNVIRICKSLPCYLKSGHMIVKSLEKAIGIRPGQTTADGKFSFELTNCIGACDQAPAMLINDDVHGDLTPEKISKILESYT